MTTLKKKKSVSYGINFNINKNLFIGLASERDSYYSLSFTYKDNPLQRQTSYKYKEATSNTEDNKYIKLIKNLNSNGLEVNKIVETPDFLALEITQFTHPNLDVIEEIVSFASYDANIDKVVKRELRLQILVAKRIQLRISAKRKTSI